MFFVFEDSNLKLYLINIMDISGYVNFSDEMSVVFRFVDGVVLVVDVVEGVMVSVFFLFVFCFFKF